MKVAFFLHMGFGVIGVFGRLQINSMANRLGFGH